MSALPTLEQVNQVMTQSIPLVESTRIEVVELEKYIQRLYAETRRFTDEHPFNEAESMPQDDQV